jgi:mRNA-degrading endonuclease RelE of RelBE toxin-antitoxin system
MRRRPVSVTEFAAYQRRADELLTEAEQDAVIDLIAYDPTRGVLIPGTGGLRKLRVAAGGSGKRGGARVIYYFYNEDIPVLLMAIFAKNEKADLSEREKKTSVRYAEEFVAQWRKK